MLHFYFDSAHTNMISEGTGANPDSSDYNGATGGADQRKLYLWNDQADKTYEDVSITAANDDANVNIQYALDNSGSPGAWAESISMPNGDYRAAVPFWRKVITAVHGDSTTRRDITHKFTATEFAK